MLTRILVISFCLTSMISMAEPVKAPAETELNPIYMPKTSLEFLWFTGQKLDAASINRYEAVKDAFGFSLNIDIPIWKYLAGGFYFQGYKGLNLLNPRSGDPDSTDYLRFYAGLGLGGFLKPQIEIPFPVGHLALTLQIPYGVELLIGLPRVNFDSILIKVPDERISPSGFAGWGFNAGALIGFEYYPIYLLGIYVQGGYRGSYQLFPTEILKEIRGTSGRIERLDPLRVEYPSYWIHGFTMTAGLKWTY